MKGYAGNILRVDLNTGSFRRDPLPEKLAEDYIGGRGFVARLLWEELPAQAEPLGPDNIFIIASGPLSGHLVPASGKTHFGCKSPANGGYADANMGGHFGPTLKYTGHDVLILTGRSDEPCMIVIENEHVEIRPAGGLWGLGSLTCEARLKNDLGEEFEIITIGPAGENLVRFACISHDFGRQAGRTGVGAVLGSKNVKAIAIRGDKSLPIHDLSGLMAASKEAYAHLRAKPGFTGWTPEGTAGITDWCNQVGAFPAKNFGTSFADHHEAINGKAVLERVRLHDKGCFCCPTPCGKYGLAKTGLGKANVEGPEYETIALFGGACMLKDIREVAYANYLCDELGLDTISAGAVASWAMECFEKGLLSKDQIGQEVAFSDLGSVAHLLDMMAYRKGELGDQLAQGVGQASRWLGQGSEAFAIHVKNLEWSGYETRNAPAMMLSYMTADVGAHHNRSWALGHDIAGTGANVHDLISGQKETTRLEKSPVGGQAEAVVGLQHLRPAFDLLGICRLQYMEIGMEVEYYEKLFELVTGRRLSWQELLKVSEKVWHLTRSISFREVEGFGRERDYPPRRFMEEPTPTGPNQGHYISREEIDQLLDEYYAARGWDKNGKPTKETLIAQGLDDVALALE